jgi:hypothetical protein
VSINERYYEYEALEELSCSEVIDRASGYHNPSSRFGEEVRIHPVAVGTEGPPTNSDVHPDLLSRLKYYFIVNH